MDSHKTDVPLGELLEQIHTRYNYSYKAIIEEARKLHNSIGIEFCLNLEKRKVNTRKLEALPVSVLV